MSSPIILIVLPLLLSLILWILREKKGVMYSLGLSAVILLVILARFLPIDETIKLGTLTFKVSDTLTVLGREFVITSTQQPFITLFYGLALLWFLGTYTIEITSFFMPLGLAMIALFIAALSVKPFLYAALLIEIAILLSIPVLSPPGSQARQGVLRLLIFQTLGMLFILLTGWMLTEIEANPAESVLLIPAGVMLGLGFVLLLGIFPFHTWIPLLAGQAQSYTAGLFFVLISITAWFFGLDFLDQYAWLRNSMVVIEALSVVGALMVAAGGIMAAFNRQFARGLGYSIMAGTGFTLIAVSLRTEGGLNIFAGLLLPFYVAVWLWSYALSVLQRAGDPFTYASGTDMLHRFPFASISLLLAGFSLAGIPFLAGFPFRLALLQGLAHQSSVLTIWALIGCLGLLTANVRSLMSLAVIDEVKEWQINEKPGQVIYLSFGIIVILALGWFPQWFLPPLLNILNMFSNL